MYDFYEMKKMDNTCVVYLATGTEDQLATFQEDTMAQGMESRVITVPSGEQFALSADKLNNGMHETDLNNAELCIMSANGIPQDLLPFKKCGPIPEEREITVYTVWQVWGKDTVTVRPGQSLQDAIDDYLENDPLPDDSDYVSDSQEIDYSMGFKD